MFILSEMVWVTILDFETFPPKWTRAIRKHLSVFTWFRVFLHENTVKTGSTKTYPCKLFFVMWLQHISYPTVVCLDKCLINNLWQITDNANKKTGKIFQGKNADKAITEEDGC